MRKQKLCIVWVYNLFWFYFHINHMFCIVYHILSSISSVLWFRFTQKNIFFSFIFFPFLVASSIANAYRQWKGHMHTGRLLRRLCNARRTILLSSVWQKLSTQASFTTPYARRVHWYSATIRVWILSIEIPSEVSFGASFECSPQWARSHGGHEIGSRRIDRSRWIERQRWLRFRQHGLGFDCKCGQ